MASSKRFEVFPSPPVPLIQNNEEFEVDPGRVLTINKNDKIPLDSNAKFVKIKTYEKFTTYINTVASNGYPYAIRFAIDVRVHDNRNLDAIQICLKTKFNDRPLVLEYNLLQSGSEARFFFKEDGKSTDFIQVENFDVENTPYNFPHLLHDIKSNACRENIIRKVGGSKNILCLRFLNMFNLRIGERSAIFKQAVLNAQNPDIGLVHACLDLAINFQSPHLSETSNNIFTSNDNGKALLEKSLRDKTYSITSFIVSNFRDAIKKWNFDEKKRISTNAYKIGLNLNFIFLIKSDFPFPDDVDEKHVMDSPILKSRMVLHGYVAGGEIDKVAEMLNARKGEPIRGIAYDLKNNSLLRKAYDNKHYEVYKFLISRGFEPGINEGFMEQEIKNDSELTVLINEITLKQAIPNDNIYAHILTTKSFIHDRGVYYDTKTSDKHFEKIYEFYKKLYENDKTSPLIRVVAEADVNIRIHFDFFEKVVKNVVIGYESSLGLAYPDGMIVIAAKNEKVALRTLAHELCHIAVLIVYENNFLPYHIGSEITEYSRILDYCLNNHTKDNVSEGIIPVVFSYEHDQFQLELIVRPPEIYVHFMDEKDPSKLNKCKTFYRDLFSYYDNTTMEDFKNYNVKNLRFVEELSSKFGLTWKNPLRLISNVHTTLPKVSENTCHFGTLVTSSLPTLAITGIHRQFGLFTKFLFIDPNQLFLQQKILREELETFLNIFKYPKVVIDFSASTTQIIQDSFPLIFGRKVLRFIIVARDDQVNEIENLLVDSNRRFLGENSHDSRSNWLKKMNHNYFYDNLTENSFRDVFLKKIVFQNIKKTLGEILEIHEKPQNMNAFKISDKLFELCLQLQIETLNVNKMQVSEDLRVKRTLVKETKKLIGNIDIQTYEKELNDPSILEKYAYETSKKDGHGHVEVTKFERVKTLVQENELLDSTQGSSYVILSSASGDGKTNTLKRIAKQFADASNLVYLIDLEAHFEKFQDVPENVFFEDFFITHVIKDRSDLEKEIFRYFYEQKTVKVLFDAFDAVSPKYKQEVLRLIKSFKGNDGSQLWITTRKNLEAELTEELSSSIFYTFSPLNPEDQKELLVNYWRSKEIDSPNLEECSNKLYERVSKSLKKNEQIGVPQLLTLFAEACIKDNKINVAFTQKFTKHEIYEKSISWKIEMWTQKKQAKNIIVQTQLHNTSVALIHQHFAMKDDFKDVKIPLHKIWVKEADNQAIIRCAIITGFVNNSAIFQHKTLKEFFMAQYVLQGLESCNNCDQLFDILTDFLNEKDKFYIVNMFVSGGLKEIISSFDDEQLETFARALEKVVDDKEKRFLSIALLENYTTLYEFLISVFKKMNREHREKQLNRELDFTGEVTKIEYPNSVFKARYNNYENKMIELVASDVDTNIKVKFEKFCKELSVNSPRMKLLKELSSILDTLSIADLKNLSEKLNIL